MTERVELSPGFAAWNHTH